MSQPGRPGQLAEGVATAPGDIPPRPVRDDRGRQRRRLSLLAAWIVAGVVDLAVTVIRLGVARGANYAGHADPSFYFQFARNLAEGRGPNVDFVWHFLVQPPSVHHYAPDYWQPLPSVLIAAVMRATGSSSLRTALTVCVLVAALVPVAAALLVRALTTHPLAPPATMALTALVPALGRWSVRVESVPFYVVFVLLALALACGRSQRRGRWLLVGIAASAAYLCRNDGLVLVAVCGAALAVRVLVAWRRDRQRLQGTVADLGAYVAGVLVTLVPWLLANLRGMGRPVPPTTRLPFLTTYEDMFAIGNRGGLGSLLAGGVGHALRIRYDQAVDQVQELAQGVKTLALICLLVLAGARLLLGLRQRKRREPGRFGWPLVAAAATAVFAFHALVSPIASLSAWKRSLVAFVPILVIATVDLFFSARSWWRRGAVLAVVAVIAVQWVLVVHSYPAAFVRTDNRDGSRTARLRPLLAAGAPSGPVVMTRNPWELTDATGFPAVQIPNNDLCTILRTAQRYGANLIVTPSRRRALQDKGTLQKAGFRRVGREGGFVVYRVPPPDRACSR